MQSWRQMRAVSSRRLALSVQNQRWPTQRKLGLDQPKRRRSSHEAAERQHPRVPEAASAARPSSSAPTTFPNGGGDADSAALLKRAAVLRESVQHSLRRLQTKHPQTGSWQAESY